LLNEYSKDDFDNIKGEFLKELDGLKDFMEDLLQEKE